MNLSTNGYTLDMFQPDSSFNVLYTPDIHKTHDFYNSLGLTINEVSDDKVVVNFGSFELHFVLNTTEPNQTNMDKESFFTLRLQILKKLRK